ncbi:MAG: Flp pilus assembly complex ATPase component TadA [Phycisphaerae bacterium]|nr:Flp pilus assembly complex ATPase component TadA [Phycisphaerae bacterium]
MVDAAKTGSKKGKTSGKKLKGPNKKESPKKPQSKGRKKRDDSALATNGSGLLSMDEAIAMLKTTRATFYRWLRSGKFQGHKAGRQWRFEKQEIERFLKGEAPRIELRGVDSLLENLRNKAKETNAPAAEGWASETPLDEAILLILQIGLAMRATDIDLAPQLVYEEKGGAEGVLRCRVDGVLHPVLDIDSSLLPSLMKRWKQFAHIPLESKAPLDGQMSFVLQGGERVDVRVCFVPTSLGVASTARLLRRRVPKMGLDLLDFDPSDMGRLKELISRPWGLIVVTGPTGCGKTTTIYSCLLHLASPHVKIMTIEDPIEMAFRWMQQTQLNEAEGITWTRTIQGFLRSAPNIIMVGELRNTETLQLCVQAGLTGHLVFTTLHAVDSPRAIKRMLDMGLPSFLIADSVKGILSQRLIRVLCPKCSQSCTPDPELYARAKKAAMEGGVRVENLPNDFRKPVGCKHCNQLGYSGQTAIAELLEITPELAEAVKRGATHEELRAVAVGQGMTTMAADGIRRAAMGITTLDEVFRVIAT